MQEIQFDYFRGMEAEQYSFYRVPKVLFTAECFKSLSCEAKVLYGLMLDRMSLSHFYCGRNSRASELWNTESGEADERTGR